MSFDKWLQTLLGRKSTKSPTGPILTDKQRDAAIAIVGDVLEHQGDSAETHFAMGRISVEKLGLPKQIVSHAILEEIFFNRKDREYVQALKNVFVLLPTFVSPEDYNECYKYGSMLLQTQSLYDQDGVVTDAEELKRLCGLMNESRTTEILEKCNDETQERLASITKYCNTLPN